MRELSAAMLKSPSNPSEIVVLPLKNFNELLSLSPGCRHGSFQPHGSLDNRTHDFLQELLGGGKIEFTVPTITRMFRKGKTA